MKTRADIKQDEFISSNGKLYINFEQVEKTDEDGNTFWEMKTLEVSDKRTAYKKVIKYYEEEQARPLRELFFNPDDKIANDKLAFINEQIAKYR